MSKETLTFRLEQIDNGLLLGKPSAMDDKTIASKSYAADISAATKIISSQIESYLHLKVNALNKERRDKELIITLELADQPK